MVANEDVVAEEEKREQELWFLLVLFCTLGPMLVWWLEHPKPSPYKVWLPLVETIVSLPWWSPLLAVLLQGLPLSLAVKESTAEDYKAGIASGLGSGVLILVLSLISSSATEQLVIVVGCLVAACAYGNKDLSYGFVIGLIGVTGFAVVLHEHKLSDLLIFDLVVNGGLLGGLTARWAIDCLLDQRDIRRRAANIARIHRERTQKTSASLRPQERVAT